MRLGQRHRHQLVHVLPNQHVAIEQDDALFTSCLQPPLIYDTARAHLELVHPKDGQLGPSVLKPMVDGVDLRGATARRLDKLDRSRL